MVDKKQSARDASAPEVEQSPGTGGPQALEALGHQMTRMVESIPGPVVSIYIRLGDALMEVTWASAGTPAAPDSAPPSAPTVSARAVPPVADSTFDISSRVTAVDETPLVEAGVEDVRAPLVGAFYAAPEPGAAPFVTAGDHVEPQDTVGIVEAMKLMNPVQAGRTGTVVSVLVDDGEPVEFDQILVRIRLDEP